MALSESLKILKIDDNNIGATAHRGLNGGIISTANKNHICQKLGG